jgi:rhodanese-related sulfurtransferase
MNYMLSRRVLFSAAAAAFILPSTAQAAKALTAAEAHRQAEAGDIVLIDIRTPEEWTETGSGLSANRLDMRRDDFTAALDKLLDGDKSKPVALICARGVRSSRLSRALREAGYTAIIDVPEGMIGSYAGPGWIERGLPLKK